MNISFSVNFEKPNICKSFLIFVMLRVLAGMINNQFYVLMFVGNNELCSIPVMFSVESFPAIGFSSAFVHVLSGEEAVA